MRLFHVLCVAVVLAACAPITPLARTDISGQLPAFGDGYPTAGDPCRRLGENDLTRQWLDHTRDLVGCPTGTAASALSARAGAQSLATIDDTVILSLPR
ncbi:MAG: hypothetical protein AB8B58_13450 [Roseobacter sp.]